MNTRNQGRGRRPVNRNSRFSGGRRFPSRNNRSSNSSQKISHSMYIAKADASYEAPSIFDETITYDDFKINSILKSNLNKKGYKYPTNIQSESIPHILAGKDIIGLASTGSGKTGAFLIPLLNKAIVDKSQRCLIVVPTRELAMQIQSEFKDLAMGSRSFATVVIGGASMHTQIGQLRRNPQFVIGTPGRLKDLFDRRVLNLKEFNNVVLDEVDRMLDMGFIPVIRFLIAQLAEQKQSLFFSATMTNDANTIAHSFLKSPITVQIEKESPHKNVDQDIVKVESQAHKLSKLAEFLDNSEYQKVLVFSRTKHGADKITRRLQGQGFKADSIHGGKTQNRRTRVLTQFRQNKINVLVATDVAARGLDIKDVSHVVNYDEPENFKDYIHRIGRTGRAGKTGKAFTFVVSG